MKINKFYNKNIIENYIDIYYNIIDSEVNALLNFLDTDKKIIGKNSDSEREVIFTSSDVYYFEMVDRKCFAYLEKSIFVVELSLQNIIERFSSDGFIRISKSMIVNVFKIKYIKSDINMKVNAVLENNEIVIVNRTYKREFYKQIRNLFEKEDDYENS